MSHDFGRYLTPPLVTLGHKTSDHSQNDVTKTFTPPCDKAYARGGGDDQVVTGYGLRPEGNDTKFISCTKYKPKMTKLRKNFYYP